MRSLARVTISTLCAVSLAGLTACGSPGADSEPKDTTTGPKPKAEATGAFADMSGTDVANKAIKTTKAATSMRLTVDAQFAEDRFKGNISANTTGDCTGTISIGAAGTMKVIKTGEDVYTQFDEAMLRDQAAGEDTPPEETDAVVDMLRGKWVQSKASEPDNKDMLEFCDLGTLTKDFETEGGVVHKGGETTVGTKRALELTEKNGKETFTILVATEGDPYLLKIESKGGKEPMTMELSEFNEPVTAKKPAAKDIIDLDAPTS